jgi:carboxypeptidase C (cathepsin A)
MKHVASKVKNSTLREFKTAHMVNMEVPDEFNKWLEGWLEGFLE